MKTTTTQFIKDNFSWAEEHTLNDKLVLPKKIKIEVLDFPQFYGKTIEEVKKHLEENYASRLPDLRVMGEIWDNIDRYPELKQFEWQWSHFFGSSLRDRDGCWSVPGVRWDGDEFDRGAHWLSGDWHSRFRVVLLRDSDLDSPLPLHSESLNIEALENRIMELEAWKERVEKIAKLMI